jgi:drug/metabolite transporter (DMT)-like permease
VAGNPQAEVEARTYVHRTTAGLVLDLAGIGLVVGGSVLGNSSSSRARRDEGAGLVFGGFASITTAIVLVVTGVPHLYDAINIYNDGVPRDAGP